MCLRIVVHSFVTMKKLLFSVFCVTLFVQLLGLNPVFAATDANNNIQQSDSELAQQKLSITQNQSATEVLQSFTQHQYSQQSSFFHGFQDEEDEEEDNKVTFGKKSLEKDFLHFRPARHVVKPEVCRLYRTHAKHIVRATLTRTILFQVFRI